MRWLCHDDDATIMAYARGAIVEPFCEAELISHQISVICFTPPICSDTMNIFRQKSLAVVKHYVAMFTGNTARHIQTDLLKVNYV
jgi:hypothetical protein